MRLNSLTFVSALSVLTACVRVSSTQLGQAPSAAISPDSVKVFATRSPAEYTEVALLTTKRFKASDSHALAALRNRAAELGCNGILLVNASNSATRRTSGP